MNAKEAKVCGLANFIKKYPYNIFGKGAAEPLPWPEEPTSKVWFPKFSWQLLTVLRSKF